VTNKTEPLLSCLPSHDFFLIVERKTNTNFGPRLTLTITLDQIESKYFLNSTVFLNSIFFFKIQISRNERQSVKFIFSNSLKVGSFFFFVIPAKSASHSQCVQLVSLQGFSDYLQYQIILQFFCVGFHICTSVLNKIILSNKVKKISTKINTI
jgi:hypothetical protein